MRDLSRDTRLFAVNSATVKAWSLEQLVEGCQRAGVTAIAPWRDIVQAVGGEATAESCESEGFDPKKPLSQQI